MDQPGGDFGTVDGCPVRKVLPDQGDQSPAQPGARVAQKSVARCWKQILFKVENAAVVALDEKEGGSLFDLLRWPFSVTEAMGGAWPGNAPALLPSGRSGRTLPKIGPGGHAVTPVFSS